MIVLLVGGLLGSIFFYFFTLFQKQSVASIPNHLRVNLSEGDPPSLHPHLGADIRGRILGKSLFEGLTRLTEDGQGALAAAEKMTKDPSGTQYTFSIRPHLWSNGRPVTAYHFENAWKQAIRPESLCSRSDLFYIIKNAKKAKCKEISLDEVGIWAPDAKTLVVELENPAPYFLELISHPVFSPVFNDDKEPSVFNGPFKLGKWERGSVLELNKNPLYWDVKAVRLDKVSIFMIADLRTEFSLFEKNKLDVVGDCFDSFSLDVLPSVLGNPNFNSQEISRIYWLYANTTQPPFDSDKIRKAFACALDRNYLAKKFLIGDSPCSTILPSTLTLISQNDLDGNAQRAQQLFEEGLLELGLTKETFPSVTISYCAYGYQKSLTELLQEHLQKVLGVPIQIQNHEWNVLVDHMIHGQFQLASCMRNAVYEDPLYFLEIFKEKNNSYNYSRWENETYKNLLNLAISMTETSLRANYLKEAEELLLQEMPVIPIYMENCKYLLHDKLKGYFINKSGYVDFKTMWFES
jgi:oligopeptide transport system substrate-binding protein